jgi:phosphatidylglycerol---prolipoprotein diacylglyceryl transferase
MNVYPINISWGIKPVLFHFAGINVGSYEFFVFLGLLVGAFVYYLEARKQKDANEYSFLIAVGALTGAAIGAKLLELIINIDRLERGSFISILFSGKTIIGGLIGGMLGSIVIKKLLKIKARKGNLFAPAIAIGLAIGRIGCFLNGCCFGKPTTLPWAVDFGDGIYRHPTQIYESLFMLCVFVYISIIKKTATNKPGYLFYLLMVFYFIFRFFIEFIREERNAFWNFTFFQLISVIALIYLFVKYKVVKIKSFEANGQ